MIQDQSPSNATYYELGHFWTPVAQYASGGGGISDHDGKQFIGEIQQINIGTVIIIFDCSMGPT